MGTSDFAVPSLDLLVQNQFNIVGVITATDKPKGRGRKLAFSPVKEYALAHDLPILQPTNLKSPQFLEELKSYQANLQVVVAFRMLPEVVWSMPEFGTFNLHASLLPEYRGAAPINWAIINGEKETGVTTFFIKHEIDTGSIVLQEKEPIFPNDNAGSLHDRLMQKGANLVLQTVKLVANDQINATPQPDINENIKTAPKLSRETIQIDWSKSAEEINNFIRGLSPYPGAWTILNNEVYKIYQSEVSEEEPTMELGSFITDNKKTLKIKCKDRLLSVLELQMQGKKKMTTQEFLRGNQL